MCDIPDFYDERRVRAKKPHRCCETGREIQTGEYYWRITGKWDGELMTFAQSEAAYHFARFLNGVGDGERAGDMSRYNAENCIPFGWIGSEVPPDLADEWERVKRGEVTRNTVRMEATR